MYERTFPPGLTRWGGTTVWLAMVLGLATGCQTPTAVPRTVTAPGLHDAPFPYASPESVGLRSSDVTALADQVYTWARDGNTVGGEVLLIKHRQIVLHEAAGWSDRERQIPLVRNSIYRLRSMTKPFIGSSVLMLVDEGRLGVDDRVALFLPSFDNERSGEITIRQLLTHTAGFVQDGYPEGYWHHATLREAIDLVGETGPPHPPGSGFRYSDVNSATLGAVVAELTGAPVEQFLQSRILDPLGLLDTFSWFGPNVPWASRMNSTYRWQGDSWEKYWDNTMVQETPFFRASGGLYSTVFDYARFLTVWMDRGQANGERILSDSTVVEALRGPGGVITWTGHLPSDHYGFHWDLYAGPSTVGELPVFGHSGSDGTVAISFPEEDAVALYFTQSRGTSTVLSFIGMALDLLKP